MILFYSLQLQMTSPDWSKSTNLRINGIPLIPTIIVDNNTGAILGHSYSSERSFALAIKTAKGIYYSRSRENVWIKSPSGRNSQKLISVSLDCDRDTLIFYVRQRGNNCHLGNLSCFGPREAISNQRPLTIGYCSGHSRERTLDLFNEIGINIYKDQRNRSQGGFIETQTSDIICAIELKPKDIYQSLANRVSDVIFAMMTLRPIIMMIPKVLTPS